MDFTVKNVFRAFPIFFYLLITFLYWGEFPSLDPMVIYRESTMFSETGFYDLSRTGYTLHPPLINIILAAAFFLFGHHPLSYNLIGFLVYTCAYYYSRKTVSKWFTDEHASIMSLLLFCNPLLIINFHFLGNDALIITGIILTLYAITEQRYFLLGAVLGAMIIMKETALLIVVWVVFLLCLAQLIKKKIFGRQVSFFIKVTPVLVFTTTLFIFWHSLKGFYGLTEWRDTIYSSAEKSSFQVVAENLFLFRFLNKFFFQNLINCFVLNFQWLYSIFTIFMCPLLFKVLITKVREQKSIKDFINVIFISKQAQYALVLLSITLVYGILVLSFPTWTVIRYGLPCYIGLSFLMSFCIVQLSTPPKNSVLCFFLLLLFLSNLTSVDPLTNYLYPGVYTTHEQKFYNIDFSTNGPDRIAYNQQFLRATKHQNAMIKDFVEANADVIVGNCIDLKLGEKLYSINVYNEYYPGLRSHRKFDCVNAWELTANISKLLNKRLYVTDRDAENLKNLMIMLGVKRKDILISRFQI
jgi:4-amino-4-deoxy-L-arabinose transferase-like glycosyltransferase